MTTEATATAGAPTAQGAVRNSAAVFVAQALGAVLGFVSMLVTLQVLRRSEYGIIAASVAMIEPIRTLATLGVDAVGVRRAAVDPTRVAAITGSLLLLRLTLACVALAIAAIFAFGFRASTLGGSWPVFAAAIVILPAAITGPFQVPFQATQQMRRLVALPVASSAVQLIATLSCAALHAPLAVFACIPAMGEVANALITRALVRKVLVSPLTSDWKLARELFREGLSLAYVTLVVVIYTRGGYYLLDGGPDGKGSVADLAAANGLVSPILMLGSALFVSFTTFGSYLASNGRYAEFQTHFASFVRRVLLVLIPVALGAMLLVPWMIELWKPQYHGAARAFRYLAFGAVWMLLCQVSSACLIALNRPRVIAWMATLNIVVFFCIAIPLAPVLRAEGVAIATFSMELVNAIAQVSIVFALLRRLQQKPLQ